MATPVVPADLQRRITPQQFQLLAGPNGRLSAKEIGTSGLLPPPPKGYQYTYQFDRTGAPLVLKKDSSLGKTLANIGILAGGGIATALTAGAASPLLAAAIGGGTGAASGALSGGWKGALIGGGLGAAGGAIGSAIGGGGGTAASATGGTGAGSTAGGTAAGLLPSTGFPAVPLTAGGLTGNLGSAAGSVAGTAAGAAGGSMPFNWGNIAKELLKDPDTYAGVAKVLGGAGQGQAAERTAENVALAQQGRTAADMYNTQQLAVIALLKAAEQAQLDRAKLGIEAPAARAAQMTRGSLQANLQPARITGLPARIQSRIPTLSGGATPAALSPLARAGGAELQRQAMRALLSGSDVPAPTRFSGGLLPAPATPAYKGAGTLESILSGAGLGAGILGALGEARRKPPVPAPASSGVTPAR